MGYDSIWPSKVPYIPQLTNVFQPGMMRQEMFLLAILQFITQKECDRDRGERSTCQTIPAGCLQISRVPCPI